jgi:hypothetical protein
MLYENIIDGEGEPLQIDGNSYRGKVYAELKKNLGSFQDFLFVEYDSDDLEVPSARFYPHDKKVLIWTSSEKKLNEIHTIRNDFFHIFSNYYWDEENVTSIPLGYNNYFEANYIPINERHYTMSFMGMLNKNRIEMVSALTGISRFVIAAGIQFDTKRTVKFLNGYLNLTDVRGKYFLSNEFNSGVSPFQYCNAMRLSKIVLSPRGFINTETFRLYEAMQYGCIVLVDKLPNRKYYKDIPAIQIDNWYDGIKTAKKILKDEDLLLELSEKHKTFYEQKLSPKATAKIIIETLENKQV